MGAPRIVVVDYHKGNLQSMCRALEQAGASARASDDPADIEAADAVVLPGVGAFADAMAYMRASGQAAAVLGAIGAGMPFLGVCLGMQLLFTRGNEQAQVPGVEVTGEGGPGFARGAQDVWTCGLGVLAGEVTRIEAPGVKVPHVGWNSVERTPAGEACPLLEGVADGEHFYFTHSYVCVPGRADDVAGVTEHGVPFASVVWDGGGVFGAQFHPEKSSQAGARVMRNFVRIATAGGLR